MWVGVRGWGLGLGLGNPRGTVSWVHTVVEPSHTEPQDQVPVTIRFRLGLEQEEKEGW